MNPLQFSALLAELLSKGGPVDPILNDELIPTWAKICQAMGTEFEPYLPIVMPPLIDVLAYGKVGALHFQ
jgi:hypothetical protein